MNSLKFCATVQKHNFSSVLISKKSGLNNFISYMSLLKSTGWVSVVFTP